MQNHKSYQRGDVTVEYSNKSKINIEDYKYWFELNPKKPDYTINYKHEIFGKIGGIPRGVLKDIDCEKSNKTFALDFLEKDVIYLRSEKNHIIGLAKEIPQINLASEPISISVKEFDHIEKEVGCYYPGGRNIDSKIAIIFPTERLLYHLTDPLEIGEMDILWLSSLLNSFNYFDILVGKSIGDIMTSKYNTLILPACNVIRESYFRIIQEFLKKDHTELIVDQYFMWGHPGRLQEPLPSKINRPPYVITGCDPQSLSEQELDLALNAFKINPNHITDKVSALTEVINHNYYYINPNKIRVLNNLSSETLFNVLK